MSPSFGRLISSPVFSLLFSFISIGLGLSADAAAQCLQVQLFGHYYSVACNSTATNGASNAGVNLSWNINSAADNPQNGYFIIYRGAPGNSPGCLPNAAGCTGWSQVNAPFSYALSVGSPLNLSFSDTSASAGIMNYYAVCYAEYYGGGGPQNVSCSSAQRASGWRAPPPAVNSLNASDGVSTDHIAVSWVTGLALTDSRFNLYRCAQGESCTPCGSGPVSGATNTLSTIFTDTTATPGIDYSYSIERVNSNGQYPGTCRSNELGFRKMASPSNLTNVPTDGDSTRITWNHPLSPHTIALAGYVIYRKTGSAITAADCSDAQFTSPRISNAATEYSDDNLPPGSYFYGVRAVGLNGRYSDCVRGSSPSEISGFSISGQVTTSSGNALSGVLLARRQSSNGSTTTTVSDGAGLYSFSGLTSNTFSITPSKSGVAFSPPSQTITIAGANFTNVNFTASCVNGGIFDEAGNCVIRPNSPTGMQASDGTSAASIELSWNSVSGATRYRVFRGSCQGELIATTSNTSASDALIRPNQVTSYYVAAENIAGFSDCASNDGYRALGAVSGVRARAVSASSAEVQWNPLADASGYRVYLSNSCSGPLRDINGSTTFNWSDLQPNVTYSFSVRALGVSGAPAPGTPCSESGQVQISPPRIDQQPQPLSAREDSSAEFSVGATNLNGDSSALRYQWLKNGVIIPGASESVLHLSSISVADRNALIRVRVSDNFGLISDSVDALLSVLLNPPSIRTEPQDRDIFIGETTSFSVLADGSELTYQWLKDGLPIANATDSTFTTSAAQLSESGTRYQVRVSNAGASGSGGTVLSREATLAVHGTSLTIHSLRSMGGPLAGAEILVDNQSQGTTNTEGALVLSNLAQHSYRVVPRKAGMSFTPSSIDIAIFNGRATESTFTAQCDGDYVFDGSDCVARSVFAVTPRVECVAHLADGRFRAYFGYTNPNNSAVTIAAGSAPGFTNTFSNSALNSTLPSTFDRDQVQGAFGVEFDGSPLTWSIEYASQGLFSATASSDSPPCAALTPSASCIRIAPDGTLMAHFGYQNANDFRTPFEVPLGADNEFSPSPVDRGQPTSFGAGNHVNDFSIPFDGQPLTWTLMGQQVSLSAASSVCAPGNSAPFANAGSAVQASCQGYVTSIALDGSASSDPDHNRLFYSWTTNCANAAFSDPNSPTPMLLLRNPGLGLPADCSATLTVTDHLLSSSATIPVQVSACAVDCRGVPNGVALLDQCGVCGGDGTSCLDCRSIPNGPNRVDRCGVCGGNDACVDCNNIPNGPALRDRCGVCGGNGTSCLGCVETKLSDVLTLITQDFFKLRDINSRALRRLRDAAADIARTNASRKRETNQINKFVKRNLKNLDFRYARLQLELYVEIPSTVVTCQNSEFCVQVDNGSTIDKYRTLASDMLRSTQASIKRLAKLTKLSGTDKKRAKNAAAARSHVDEKLMAVPRVVSRCG